MPDFSINQQPVSGPVGSPSEQAGQAPQYGQNPVTYDAKAVVGEINQKFRDWRQFKRPIEVQWFVNSATLRGIHSIRWNDLQSKLELQNIPNYKIRPSINKVLPKYRMRKAKFLKTSYTPVVTPATGNHEDKLDADASQKALEYAQRKTNLLQIYKRTVENAVCFGKGFIWVYWDPNASAMVADPNHSSQAQEMKLGDIAFEAGSPFEVLVPDLGIQTIGEQSEIMRCRAVPVDELKLQFKDVPEAQTLQGDTSNEDLFQYQKQIATLANRTNTGLISSTTESRDKNLNFIVKKELFQRPCQKYPQGRYIVTAGEVILRYQEVLPYGFSEFVYNPYPIVEFSDIPVPGQFWPTSTVEQLAGPQQEYNEYRQRLYNHLRKQSHPKILVSVFNKFPQNAWTDEAGEIITIMTPPGIPPPQVIVPPPISNDLWKALELTGMEIDQIVTLPPVTGGEVSTTNSGFQVNQLQEATDSVHAPDIADHAQAFVELYQKARKIMAQGYQMPRLINITGRSHIPDVVEFSKDNIDENADIVVYTGSTLSNSPAVRTQQVIELWNSGILQNQNDPVEAQRKALTMLDADGIGEFQEEKKADESKAQLENLGIARNEHVLPPLPFDDHKIHYDLHTLQTKSPEFQTWDQARQQELFAHILLHVKFINPQTAIQLAMDLGMPQLIPFLLPPQMPGQPGQPGQQAPNQPQAVEPPPPNGNQPPSGGVAPQ